MFLSRDRLPSGGVLEYGVWHPSVVDVVFPSTTTRTWHQITRMSTRVAYASHRDEQTMASDAHLDGYHYAGMESMLHISPFRSWCSCPYLVPESHLLPICCSPWIFLRVSVPCNTIAFFFQWLVLQNCMFSQHNILHKSSPSCPYSSFLQRFRHVFPIPLVLHHFTFFSPPIGATPSRLFTQRQVFDMPHSNKSSTVPVE